MLARGVDVLFAERVHDVGPLEQPGLLLRGQPVEDISILEDLSQAPAPPVLARDVGNHLFLGRVTGEEEREGIAQEIRQAKHGAIV